MKLVSVVLAGGSGSRLWPVSRKSMPKPFMKIGGSTLFEQAISRGVACGASDHIVVCNQDHFFLCEKAKMCCKPSYILEPEGRNTAPAIALAAFSVMEQHGGDTIMLVLSADHLIPNTPAFTSDVIEAKHQAEKGEIVVFGIVPTSPETGYGYIKVENKDNRPQKVLKFTEKPNEFEALEYLSSGQYYWNSGMFCFSAGTFLSELKKCSPEVYDAAELAFKSASQDGGNRGRANVLRINQTNFLNVPDISVDYAVMERSDAVMVVPARFGWSDVGTWNSISEAHTPDSNGNTTNSNQPIEWLSIDTKNTHLHVETQGAKAVVATIGIENLAIVHTPDAILICEKKSSQKIKEIVGLVAQKDPNSLVGQTAILPQTVQRPWGTYTSLKKEEPGYQVKRITVSPGQRLSLQYHHHRAEHWTVVKGKATVEVDGVEFDLGPGEHKYIPLGARHRLTNWGEEEMVLIEVQVGDYLGEDDIVRLEDIYGRQ
ncbi:mannose-1-phosphate guanylyltransferase/mannose-6-phosphate isomerase [Marivivens sp. JLT3646]|uniref:mannose-1-phosphate guanylyltransferase/mannose-6-phosphate isomerase n=1 Tax=Marivivens sp. JLT3646 TaxID=1920883 RepID=UPI0007FE8CC8|nr:mannose-1-phosphate guanylyltransferase/mannose-6-phosphate isomerase [Marivivens sp. JLT3646]APO88542.1 mannose-1-phosphate guanylyltransferase/mannose-6-phosphate isomerase [Marivivens sp. JLT3646]OBR39266.1 mannose-1-phosphate guanylyltransferase/mannose-6-phosphate isomerase [Donghicola sp. JL3646]